MQVPLSFVFGYFTDFGTWIISSVNADTYFMRLFMVIAGTAVLGFGISLSVTANVIMNSGEAFVKAIADTAGKSFSAVKIIFDISCVAISAILSLVLFDFKIKGAREGTVIAALCTRLTVKFFYRILNDKIQKFLNREKFCFFGVRRRTGE